MDSLVVQKFNIRLVQTVKKYPIIYNPNLKGYKDTNRKNKVWEYIAKQFNTEPELLKTKWKWIHLGLRKKLRTMELGKYVRPYYLYEHLKFLLPYMKNVKEPVAFMKRIKYEESDEEQDRGGENSPEQNVDQNETAEGIYDNEGDPLNCDYDEDDIYSPNTVKRDFHVSIPADGQARKSNAVQNSTITCTPSRSLASTSTGNAECGEVAASRKAKIEFLNSILPDLNEMSSSQMRLFKSRVLQLVDKILRENKN
ncbi:uncharacterized protein LOC101455444 [Ceratitis capitata]|uniref:uncharacterized protein LOC101455444 n=1 Tax=Ceratitis capitata TaxID=7213 RepID=UPI00032A1231|nr:uncharacterized protein LOC101455444 [Ceratitis capitata]